MFSINSFSLFTFGFTSEQVSASSSPSQVFLFIVVIVPRISKVSRPLPKSFCSCPNGEFVLIDLCYACVCYGMRVFGRRGKNFARSEQNRREIHRHSLTILAVIKFTFKLH